MVRLAPRISPRLVEAVERLDDRRLPIAEVARRVCARADALGLTRPSYERLRELVHEHRARTRRRGPGTAEVLLDVTLRARPPIAILDHLSGVGVPPLERAQRRTSL